VATHLLVRIPLATALAEELVFRGVILGLATRTRRPRDALILSALAFGLWHVGAALHPERRRSTAGVVGDRLSPTPVVVAGDVAATTIAGLGFGWLRLRSHSIVAPTMAHAAVNASAYVATRFGPRLGAVPGE
jgi:membrane protease YdiL (CAAX protease family)